MKLKNIIDSLTAKFAALVLTFGLAGGAWGAISLQYTNMTLNVGTSYTALIENTSPYQGKVANRISKSYIGNVSVSGDYDTNALDVNPSIVKGVVSSYDRVAITVTAKAVTEGFETVTISYGDASAQLWVKVNAAPSSDAEAYVVQPASANSGSLTVADWSIKTEDTLANLLAGSESSVMVNNYTGDITIPSNRTVKLSSTSNAQIGTVVNRGTLTLSDADKTLEVAESISNYGTITYSATGGTGIKGNVINYQTFSISGDGGSDAKFGTIDGSITNYGTLSIANGANTKITGKIYNHAQMTFRAATRCPTFEGGIELVGDNAIVTGGGYNAYASKLDAYTSQISSSEEGGVKQKVYDLGTNGKEYNWSTYELPSYSVYTFYGMFETFKEAWDVVMAQTGTPNFTLIDDASVSDILVDTYTRSGDVNLYLNGHTLTVTETGGFSFAHNPWITDAGTIVIDGNNFSERFTLVGSDRQLRIGKNKTNFVLSSDQSLSVTAALGQVYTTSCGYEIDDTYDTSYVYVKRSGSVVHVDTIALDKTEMTLAVGATNTLTATITPANATDKFIVWSAGDINVASIETPALAADIATIKVIGQSAGTSYVFARPIDWGTANPQDYVCCTVTVTRSSNFFKDANDDNLWHIANLAGLQEFRDEVNAGNSFAGKTVVLDVDIDMSSIASWDPIGQDYETIQGGDKLERRFAGTFDGNNKTLSNLTINDNTHNEAGLFGVTGYGSTFKDLTLDSPTVNGRVGVGTLAGKLWASSVINCHVTGDITVTGYQCVGGLAGSDSYTDITGCSVIGDDKATSVITGNYVAGIEDGDNIGGLVGMNGPSDPAAQKADQATSNCSVGNLTLRGWRKVGGLSGQSYNRESVYDCSVGDIDIICLADTTFAAAKEETLAFGGMVGIFAVVSDDTKYRHAENSYLEGTVSNVTITCANDDVNEYAKMGIISGGQRGNNEFVEPTDTQFNVTVSGTNSTSGTKVSDNTDKIYSAYIVDLGSVTVWVSGLEKVPTTLGFKYQDEDIEEYFNPVVADSTIAAVTPIDASVYFEGATALGSVRAVSAGETTVTCQIYSGDYDLNDEPILIPARFTVVARNPDPDAPAVMGYFRGFGYSILFATEEGETIQTLTAKAENDLFLTVVASGTYSEMMNLKENMVATIDNVPYLTFAEAIAAADAADVDVITILDDSITTSPDPAWYVYGTTLKRDTGRDLWYVAGAKETTYGTYAEALNAASDDATKVFCLWSGYSKTVAEAIAAGSLVIEKHDRYEIEGYTGETAGFVHVKDARGLASLTDFQDYCLANCRPGGSDGRDSYDAFYWSDSWTVVLDCNIDLDNKAWTAVNMSSLVAKSPMEAKVDGNGKTILNLSVNVASGYAGLFTGCGLVSNLKVDGANIYAGSSGTAGTVVALQRGGGLVNVVVSNAVVSGKYVGGIVGNTFGDTFTGNIVGNVSVTTSVKYVGGIAGQFTIDGNTQKVEIKNNVLDDVRIVYSDSNEIYGSVLGALIHSSREYVVTDNAANNITTNGTLAVRIGNDTSDAYNAIWAPRRPDSTTHELNPNVTYANNNLTPCYVPPVAQIGTTKYATLQGAINAAVDGDTIELLTDIEVTEKVSIAKSIVLDGNGKKITATTADAKASGYYVLEFVAEQEGMSLTVKDLEVESSGFQTVLLANCDYDTPVAISNVKFASDGSCVYANGYAKMLVTGSEFKHEGAYAAGKDPVYYAAVHVGYSGEINLDGCKVESTDYGIATFPSGGTITLTDVDIAISEESVSEQNAGYALFAWNDDYTTYPEYCKDSVITFNSGKVKGGFKIVDKYPRGNAKNKYDAVIHVNGGIFSVSPADVNGVVIKTGYGVVANADEATKDAYPWTVAHKDGVYVVKNDDGEGYAEIKAVKVEQEWINTNVPKVGDTATTAEIEDALNKPYGTTNLKKWQAYVLNQTTPIKVTQVGTAGALTTTLGYARTDTGLDVSYSLVKIQGGETNDTACAKDAFKADLETGLYKVRVHFKPTGDTSASEITVDSENTVGVLKTQPTGQFVVVPVPFKELGGDDAPVKVASYIRSGLADGDVLHVYNGNSYDSWTYNGTSWDKTTNMTVNDENTASSSESEEPSVATLSRGTAAILRRAPGNTAPLVFVGDYTGAAEEQTIAAGWNLVASPSLEAFNPATKFTSGKIQIPGDGLPKNYTFKNGKWGYSGVVEVDAPNGNGKIKMPGRIEVDTLPAGTGFWYFSDSQQQVEW